MPTVSRTGVIQGGRVVFDPPLDLPDGTRVTVRPADDPADTPDIVFMTEEEQDGSPEEVERWIAAMRSAPALPESAAKFFEPTDWDRDVGRMSAEAVLSPPDHKLP